LWKGARKPSGYTLASWSSISKPKSQGGWGLRDLDLFNQALAAKFLWRALFHKSLWAEVIRKKYLKGVEVVPWLRKDHLSFSSSSIVWRKLLSALPMIKNWIAWKVGSGVRVLVGMDPHI
jgi:hypothetical protein